MEIFKHKNEKYNTWTPIYLSLDFKIYQYLASLLLYPLSNSLPRRHIILSENTPVCFSREMLSNKTFCSDEMYTLLVLFCTEFLALHLEPGSQ